MQPIPVMRPKLPSADRVFPYLKSIDESRVYTNFGPLARSLEGRLAARYGVNESCVATVANATLGLALSLAVQQPPPGTLCIIPAWTFVACAHAVVLAGLIPYFVDVDPETWALDPDALVNEIEKAPAKVGAVMPVAPFGLPLNVASWESFQSRTGVAMTLDCSASFDSLVPSEIPSVVSLHATKTLGAGEGGFVISKDASMRQEIWKRSNFGFAGSRLAQVLALNAKMSEYPAAVAHAALDDWDETRAQWKDVAQEYGHLLKSNRIRLQRGFGEDWVSSTCVLEFSHVMANRVEELLNQQNVESRHWWGAGAHGHPATSSFPRTALTVTETLARSTLAIPFYRDITHSEIKRVAEIVLFAAEPAQHG